jgi:hypothetical protein
MWRNEERLEFWLSGGKGASPKGRAGWLQRLQIRGRAADVQELPLGIESRPVALDDELSMNAKVLDSPEMSDLTQSPDEDTSHAAIATARIHSSDLLGAAPVRRIPMPDAYRTRVYQKMLTLYPSVRSSAAEIGSAAVQAPELLRDRLTEVMCFDRLSLHDPLIHANAQISEFPHRRESAMIEQFNDSERQSFLHEAAALKLVPSDRAELLAVFRHVPIEVISRLCFLADKNEIRYSISGEPKRTQTRVHDMAAIRDATNKEIHLVPHRTKSRLVSLA